jgi:uncharacterized protein
MSQSASSSNRKPLPRGSHRRPLLFFLLLGLLFAIYAAGVEPYWIEVTRSTIHGPVAAPLKIAHLSDVHTRGLGRREQKIFALFDQEKPDVIVIAGDTLASYGGNYSKCRAFYQRLHAPLGVWFVRGNWENWKPVRRERAFYESAGVHLLLNAGQPLRPDVWIAGLDDPYSGTAKLETALAGAPPGAFTLLLFHSPGFFDQAASRVNLCLTGHTHGGQARLPFFPPLWLPGGCGRFIEGWYEESGSKMYVSRGLGMSVLPIRFFCRPELAFITIEP